MNDDLGVGDGGARRPTLSRRRLLAGAIGGAALTVAPPVRVWAESNGAPPGRTAADQYPADTATAWYDLLLALVKETPGYSPPVASRAFGCAGVAVYEAVLPGLRDHRSLVGVLNELGPVPATGRNAAYHWPSVANAALAEVARTLFPTAPAARLADVAALEAALAAGAPRGIGDRSAQRGRAVAAAVLDWSATDGGHEGYLRNFPADYTPPVGPGLWVPTPPGFQPALQPRWGTNRCVAIPSPAHGHPGAHPAFSTEPGSPFHDEAVEVYEAVNNLTDEQLAIARFWSDDPGTTATPPGHSISILSQVLRARDASLAEAVAAYALLGVAVCDAFIACWAVKYEYNLLRPITYVRDFIDASWGNPLPLNTPPFPEYTSGHSAQSGAAAAVLTSLFGTVAFTDHTHDSRGLAARSFATFEDAAAEAAISRLYGGIHYRAAIDRGVAQGRAIGELVAALPLRG